MLPSCGGDSAQNVIWNIVQQAEIMADEWVAKSLEFAPFAPSEGEDEPADVEIYLEEFNRQLYDAGLQEVLDEANRQLEEFLAKQ